MSMSLSPISFTQTPILSSVITQFFNFILFMCFDGKDMENIVYIYHLFLEVCKSFMADEHLPNGPGWVFALHFTFMHGTKSVN